MNIKENDIKFGLSKEDEYFEILKTKFDNTLEKTNDRYNLFDFKSENYYIELKSRRNTHNKYPDTMVGYNKVKFALNSDKNIIFCFAFTDGLFYYKFDNLDITNEKLRFDFGGRNDRGQEEYKDYCFIPVELLVQF